MEIVKRTKSSKKTPVKHKKIFKRTHNPVVLKKLSIALVITCLAVFAYVKVYPYTYDAKQAQKLQDTIQQVQKLQQQTKQIKADSAQQQSDKDKKLEELNKQLQQAQEQLQAKAASKASTVYAAAAPSYAMPANGYKAYIYDHESGNNPGAVNSIGCRGLGQACPGSKLLCSDTDYTCQDEYFTNYAMQRYGSWENAYVFWVNNHWW